MPPLPDIGAAVKLPINIVVLGAESVGKTSLSLQFINETKVESESCKPTIETSFYKDVILRDPDSSECDSICLEELNENSGVECFWKMDDEKTERKHSAIGLHKQKHKGSNNNVCEQEEFKMVLKVTDTASYKPTYSPRKSLKERLAMKLTPRRRALVTSPEGPVRRRYLRNTENAPKSMNAVPSFIYRKSEGKSTMHDSVIHSADAFILVYSVQDRKSFETLQKIRAHIHAVRGCPCATEVQTPSRKEGTGRRRLGSSLAGGSLGSCLELPPIAVVGTHIDLTAPLVSPCTANDSKTTSNESLLNYAYTFTPKRRGGESARKRTFQKQISIAAEVLSQASKPRGPEVTAARIRGVVGAWPECVGYAEVSNNNVPRVRTIFGHIASQVVRNRTSHPRKRVNSSISVFSRKSETENSSSFSCCPFKFSCFR